MDRVKVGEPISFFPMNTFSYPPLATRTISSVSRIEDASASTILVAAYANASAVAKSTPCSACNAGLNKYTSAQLWNVSFSVPLESMPPLSIANVDSVSAFGAVITNCSFSDSISNLGRFKSSGGRIERTTWERTMNQNLEIEPLQNWLEGPLGIHNVTVSDCFFHGTRSSPIHIFGAINVSESNNTYDPT